MCILVRDIAGGVHVFLEVPCHDYARKTAVVLVKDGSGDLN